MKAGPHQTTLPQLLGMNERKAQSFDYLVVMDLEATCDNRKGFYPQEIIEFSCVLVNANTDEVVSEFQVCWRFASAWN